MRSRMLSAICVLAVLFAAPVAAQVGNGGDATIGEGGHVPLIFVDGVNQYGEIADKFGNAYIDAASSEVLLDLASGSHVISFDEIVNAASQGNPTRSALIRAEIDYVFRQGGVTLGYMNADRDSQSLNGPRNYCLYTGCDPSMPDWNWDNGANWDLIQRRPPSPPPPPPPPRTDECAEAFAEIVEARLAVEAAEALCKNANTRPELITCGVMVLYGGVRTSLAATRGANCVVPPTPPPPPPPGYWGWN